VQVAPLFARLVVAVGGDFPVFALANWAASPLWASVLGMLCMLCMLCMLDIMFTLFMFSDYSLAL